MPLRIDAEQRFSCRGCARCCRRGWDIAVTAGEVEAYRRAGAARWFRDSLADPAEPGVDPFEPLGEGTGFRIRKRADGSCGFLSARDRCRIHEEMGPARKPLTCRSFPFRLHPLPGETIVEASFSCPTVVANEGVPLSAQRSELAALRREWERNQSEPERPLELARGRPLARPALGTLRDVLREMLDRSGPDGAPDLGANVARMGAWLTDLSRHRVVRLAPDRLAEYVALTGRHAAASDRQVPRRRASVVARLLSRGFLFAVLAVRLRLDHEASSGRRSGLRLRMARLLAHVHGLWPPSDGVDVRALRRVSVPLESPGIRTLVHHYLRSTIATLGSRRPVLDELALAFARLNAALALAAMHAARRGAASADEGDVARGLTEAADVDHVGEAGPMPRLLDALSGGIESLPVFAERTRPKDR
jgi:Fe-S-cluster containining protein